MTYDETLDSMRDVLKQRNFLGDKFVDMTYDIKKIAGHTIEHTFNVTFQNYWGDKRTMIYHIGITKTLFSDPIKEIPRIKGASCDNVRLAVRATVPLEDIMKWISGNIRKLLKGSRHEVAAFEFFQELAKEEKLLGEPIRATQKEDRSLGVDIFIPVKKKYRKGHDEARIDIKSVSFYQKRTAERNRRKQRPVSTLCFSRKEELFEAKQKIVEAVVSHAREKKIFDLDVTKPAA